MSVEHRGKLLRSVGKIVFTVVVLWLLFRAVGWRDVGAALGVVAWPWVLAMYGAMLLRRVMDAAQMKFILASVGVRVPVGRVFLANALSSLYGLVVPGDIAASGAKWWNLSAATGRKSMVLSAIVYNRIVLMAVPVLVGVAALAIENPFPGTWLAEAVVAMGVAIVLVFLCLYHPLLGAHTDRCLRRIARVLPAFIEDRSVMVLDSTGRLRQIALGDHLIVLALASTAAVVGYIRFGCGLLAMGLDVPLLSVLWIFAFLVVGRMLPLTIGNLGIREGLLIVALAPFDVQSQTAVALGLVLFTSQLLSALIGAGYQTALAFGWAEWGPVSPEPDKTPLDRPGTG